MLVGQPAKQLDLEDLPTACPRLSAAAGHYMAEAATVCLEEQGHGRETKLRVTGSFRVIYLLHRPDVSDRMYGTFDPDEATEFGACGIAILVMRDQTGFTVQRAFKGEGFDYWLGTADADRPFQNTARLEVSGIRRGSVSRIRARLKEKREQVLSSERELPTYIAVVEFSTPEVRVELL